MKKLFLTLLMALPLMAVAETSTVKDEVTVDVIEPGTLAQLILNETQNLSDVVTLHVSGTLNDADLNTLKSQLPNMQNIDMAGLQMTRMPDSQFQYNKVLVNVILPTTLKVVGRYAFHDCYSLESITFPEGLEEIEYASFVSCGKLTSITLPTTLKSIGSEAFEYCDIHTLVLPGGLTEIGNSTFSNNSNLTSITLPSTLKVIPSYAFAYCYLSELTIPEGVERIESDAFYYAFRSWFKHEGEYGVKRITITTPSTLKYIGSSAFQDHCIYEVNLNEGLETLRQSCFAGTNISEITIPSTVSFVGCPFNGECKSLSRINFLPLVPPANYDNYLFGSKMTNNTTRTLVVPSVSVDQYKQKVGYDDFGSMYETNDELSDLNIFNDFTLHIGSWARVGGYPNVSLQRDDRGGSDYDGSNWGSLTIEGSAEFNVPFGNFHLYTDLSQDYSAKEGYNYNQYYYPRYSTSVIARKPARADLVEWEVEFGNNHWYAISLPFDVKVSNIEPLSPNTWFVVREYDGKARADGEYDKTWHQLGADDMMEGGKAYIIYGLSLKPDNNYVYESNYRLLFKSENTEKKNDFFAYQNVTSGLTDYSTEFEHNRGWQMVGNPFPCYFNLAETNITVPITRLNPYYQRYEALRPGDDDYVLSPMEAFFVQYSNSLKSVTFRTEGRQLQRPFPTTVAARRDGNDGRQLFNLVLNANGKKLDHTRFVINADARLDYEADKDAAKMRTTDNLQTLLYTLQNGTQMAINERPMADGEVQLGLETEKAGTYTIALQTNTSEPVQLVDLQEGRTIDLTADSYTFTAAAGKHNQRFLLRVGAGATTGIVQYVATQSQQTEPAFNLNGQRVSTAQKGIVVKNGKKVIVK